MTDLIELARHHRANQTKSESILWEALRNRRFKGLKFRRQHPIGRYIVNFYCPSERLIIEIDGPFHGSEDQKEYDHIRDREIQSQNLRVIRFASDEIENRLGRVLMRISEITSPP